MENDIEIVIDLGKVIKAIKKSWLLIISMTLFAMIITAIMSYFVIKPTYKADISVIIGSTSPSDGKKAQSYNDVLMYQKIVQSYREIAKSRLVAEDVINELDLNMLADDLIAMITVSAKADTEILDISVEANNSKQAMDIANQYAKSLKKISYEIRNSDNVRLLDNALLPKSPDSLRPLLNILIALTLGFMLSVLLVFFREQFDNTIKQQEDIEQLFDIPMIGTIPLIDGK